MGLPRYIASAGLGDPERTVDLAEELAGGDDGGPVCLVQCGRESPMAAEVSRALQQRGRRTKLLLIDEREVASSDLALSSLSVASSAWVFADDLLAAFYTLF